jgi:HEPN domain-containing protein
MSTEKNVVEALRWLDTAEDDLDSAQILKTERKFAHSCFHAQQAGEKALKAVWYSADADPWGHSIKKLIEDLEKIDAGLFQSMKSLTQAGTVLDRFYVPTRYPNGLPEITPREAFFNEDAEACLESAGAILQKVRALIS